MPTIEHAPCRLFEIENQFSAVLAFRPVLRAHGQVYPVACASSFEYQLVVVAPGPVSDVDEDSGVAQHLRLVGASDIHGASRQVVAALTNFLTVIKILTPPPTPPLQGRGEPTGSRATGKTVAVTRRDRNS